MSRFRQTIEDEGSDSSIDISPLIDCVFILLIFFIVTTVFVEETGVEVDKPTAASASDLEKQSVFIAVTEDGRVVYDKRDIGVGGVASLVKRQLQGGSVQIPVIIQGDANSKTGLLVRVIGEAKAAGAETVNIAAGIPGQS